VKDPSLTLVISARTYRPSFRENMPKTLVIVNERFGLVFTKTGSINSGTAEIDKVSFLDNAP
jgi:hypothetical protein